MGPWSRIASQKNCSARIRRKAVRFPQSGSDWNRGRFLQCDKGRCIRCSNGNGGFLLPGGQRFPGGYPNLGKGMVRMTKEKHPNMNYAGNMNVDAWRDRQISKRLKARIAAQTQEFIWQHGSETNEQLRRYVQQIAIRKQRMPHPLEVPGGPYLSSRLGDWNQLAKEFGVRPVSAGLGRKVYKRLRKQEAELFAQERRVRKEEKRREARQQAISFEKQP